MKIPVLMFACVTAAWAAVPVPRVSQGARPPAVGVLWERVLAQPEPWYGTAEARTVADHVLEFQRPSGGWPKNLDMTHAPSRADLHPESSDATIDNGATFTQIRLLAAVNRAAPDPRYRGAAQKGIEYLLAAQYLNGGWPQFYPLRSDYSRRITFNDDAMMGAASLLEDVASGASPWTFVDAGRRDRAKAAVTRAIDVVLRTQIRVNGTLTAWCAQHDEVTLEPRGARAYEHPSLSGRESVDIVRFLMRHSDTTPAAIPAVEAAVAWFQAAVVKGWRVQEVKDASLPGGFDRVMVQDPAAPPLWARFYEIGTNRPIFSGRDGVVRYTLSDIEHERRVGYSWAGDWPAPLLATEYPRWRARRGL